MTDPARGEFSTPPPDRTGPKTMTDLLALADRERTLMNWLVRQRGASLVDIVAHTQGDPAIAQTMLDDLIARGFLLTDATADGVVFKPHLVSRKPRTVPDQLWNALD